MEPLRRIYAKLFVVLFIAVCAVDSVAVVRKRENEMMKLACSDHNTGISVNELLWEQIRDVYPITKSSSSDKRTLDALRKKCDGLQKCDFRVSPADYKLVRTPPGSRFELEVKYSCDSCQMKKVSAAGGRQRRQSNPNTKWDLNPAQYQAYCWKHGAETLPTITSSECPNPRFQQKHVNEIHTRVGTAVAGEFAAHSYNIRLLSDTPDTSRSTIFLTGGTAMTYREVRAKDGTLLCQFESAAYKYQCERVVAPDGHYRWDCKYEGYVKATHESASGHYLPALDIRT